MAAWRRFSAAQAVWLPTFRLPSTSPWARPKCCPDLLKGVDAKKVSCVQFLPNGVAGITFATTEDCDRAVNAGIKFRDTALKVAPVEVRSSLVYLRDCPTEVPSKRHHEDLRALRRGTLDYKQYA